MAFPDFGTVEEEPRTPAIPLLPSVPIRTSACSPPSHGTATWAPVPAAPSFGSQFLPSSGSEEQNRPGRVSCVLGMGQPPIPGNQHLISGDSLFVSFCLSPLPLSRAGMWICTSPFSFQPGTRTFPSTSELCLSKVSAPATPTPRWLLEVLC